MEREYDGVGVRMGGEEEEVEDCWEDDGGGDREDREDRVKKGSC